MPAIEAAEDEVLFITCFWAPSPSLSQLPEALLSLSRKSLRRNDGSKIRVSLCLSSRSLLQKLFHTASDQGHVYTPSEWSSKLGLPPPEQLEGLDLQVKSKFFRPFSVMHPKLVIVDRTRAFLPSCNLSWEDWFECCISLDGEIVGKLLEFVNQFWGERNGSLNHLQQMTNVPPLSNRLPLAVGLPRLSTFPPFSTSYYQTVMLPSPHHASLKYSIPFCHIPAPPTPLNAFVLDAFSTAQHAIDILTPNLTSQPVVDAIFAALARGVNVTVTTNRRMMMLEQIVTAGTITEICVWKMVRRYRKMLNRSQNRIQGTRARGIDRDLEEGREISPSPPQVGKLKINYYHPHQPHDIIIATRPAEPVKSHIKCTIIDDEKVVLGSGNMDRASWYTSQELGVAFYGEGIVQRVWGTIQEGLEGRVEEYFK